MATTFEVKLSLRDAEAVKKGLASLGAEGQRALKRIEDAGEPASRGLQLINTASESLQEGLEGVADGAGELGGILKTLGAGGLAAAAGIGALLLGLRALSNLSNQMVQDFADIADASARVGASAENFQALRIAFETNAASAQDLERVLSKLRDSVGRALGGDVQFQADFARFGISLAELQNIGDDTAQVFSRLAQGLGNFPDQAEAVAVGTRLASEAFRNSFPAVQAVSGGIEALTKAYKDQGLVVREDVVKAYGAIRDENFKLDARLKTTQAEAVLPFAQSMHDLRKAFIDAIAEIAKTPGVTENVQRGFEGLSTFVRTGMVPAIASLVDVVSKAIELLAGFISALDKLSRIDAAIRQRFLGGASLSKGVDLLNRLITGGADLFGVDIGNLPPEAAEISKYIQSLTPQPAAAAKTATARPVIPVTPTARTRSGGRSATPELVDFSGRPLSIGGLSDQEAQILRNRPVSPRVSDYESYLDAQDKATAESQKQLQEFTETFQNSWERVDEAVADTTDTVDDFTTSFIDLDKISTVFGSVLSTAFEDAIINGEKLENILDSLTETIERFLIRAAITGLLNTATSSLTNAFAPQQPATYGDFGTTSTFGATAAFGQAFSAGHVTPFARGGVVTRPTIFPMAVGAGLMGEAGPEAVLPLKRDVNGNLGVGSAGQTVNVVVNNQANADVDVQQRRDASGSLELMIGIIEKRMAAQTARPGTTLNRAVTASSNPLRAM